MCLGTSSDVVQDHDVIKQVLISIELIRLATPQENLYCYWIMIRFQKFFSKGAEEHSCIDLRNSQKNNT